MSKRCFSPIISNYLDQTIPKPASRKEKKKKRNYIKITISRELNASTSVCLMFMEVTSEKQPIPDCFECVSSVNII
jgi:hypothetical protein